MLPPNMSTPSPQHPDLENGSSATETEKWQKTVGDTDPGVAQGEDEGGEYTKLVRYISTYNSERRRSMASGMSGEDEEPKKAPWYAPWKKAKATAGGPFEMPDDWVNTNMQQGLSAHEVESRRKRTGWNELTTEKENMFIKFLMFFTGPILYGKHSIDRLNSFIFVMMREEKDGLLIT